MANITIREVLENILDRYAGARTTEQFAAHDLRETFENIKQLLLASSSLQQRNKLRIKWSMGQGNWAKVPWIAFLDERETDTTQNGVYCVYLFRQDMSGVYLTYNQGVTRLIQENGKPAAYKALKERAGLLRDSCKELIARGFSMGDTIDLKADPGLGADYEPSTIAHKLYEKGKIPDDGTLLEDLEATLFTYDKYLQGQQKPATAIPPTVKPPTHESAKIGSLLPQQFLHEAASPAVGLRVIESTIVRFAASLLSKRFLILTGLAGSGKTKIAQAFARWITPDPGWIDDADHSQGKNPNPYYALVPVGADWTGNENIIGYPNGLDSETYVVVPEKV